MTQFDLDAVKAQLAARVATIGLRSRGARPGEIAHAVDEVRGIAAANGLRPAVAVAHALETALSRGERGPLVEGWLALLGDAIGSDRTDPMACEAYAGACSVRFYN